MWRRSRDESGIAMIGAILLGAIIVTILTTMAVRSVGDVNAVRADRLWEQSLHTGDAGVDHTLTLLTQNRFYTSGHTLPAFEGASAEKAWVLEAAEARSAT
ncbi:MAG TPA: hypothetical protein VM840_13355, partial [Actinomycetota bacterium]|nr:hypothetical protein [Actinomycetota bacterium]